LPCKYYYPVKSNITIIEAVSHYADNVHFPLPKVIRRHIEHGRPYSAFKEFPIHVEKGCNLEILHLRRCTPVNGEFLGKPGEIGRILGTWRILGT
jgi:hypothetical protein